MIERIRPRTRKHAAALALAVLGSACGSGGSGGSDPPPEACLQTCCDADQDGFGRGATCAGPDCDDGNPAVYPGAPERCDGVDNDCVAGGLDAAPIDCAPAACAVEGGVHYVLPAEVCTSGACVPQPPLSCGTFLCSAAEGEPACTASCSGDADCAGGAHCSGGACVPDVAAGGPCSTARDCAAGLFCADGVCCDSQCSGTCEACNVAGSVGACTAVPEGMDPDAECPGVSCSGYYFGWSGDSCRRKADVPAAQATCSGARSCRTTAEECTAQTSAGPVTLTCDALCQDPAAGTCTGTSAGACTNLNLGTETCGTGPCQVTAPRCVNGHPNACVPNSGAASAEVCDDQDNDCDGAVDDGSFADAFEVNDSCSSYKTLPQVGSDQTQSATATLYPSGDVDVFRIHAAESDSSCACCDFFCTDEDYRLTVTLAVPAGAGSYRFCANLSQCGATSCQNVAAGGSGSWTFNLDGTCPGADDYDVFVTVDAAASPGFECSGYSLTYFFDAGVCL